MWSEHNDPDAGLRIVRVWQPPPGGVSQREGTVREMDLLFSTLPEELSDHLRQLFPPEMLVTLNEIYLQLGHVPECIFVDESGESLRKDILDRPCTESEIDLFASFFGASDQNGGGATTKRRGIPGTLHRVSLITHPMRDPEPVLGVAVRVGRALSGLIQTMAGGGGFLVDLARSRKSLLLVGKPGVGKTTVLREIAHILSHDPRLNVVVVDKTCEIAGDGKEPHPAIGKARWMPVGKPNMQHEIMREAVENQTPDVVIVDEISTPQEVEAARTIAQRGVQLVATVHGTTLPELLNCRERSTLVGGCTSVTLSSAEAERRFDKRKQVMKRNREPVFGAAIELHSRTEWVYHPDVKGAVDSYLDGAPCDAERFEPGRAVAVACIPGEGSFTYCDACGTGPTCDEHTAGHGDRASSSRRNGERNDPWASGLVAAAETGLMLSETTVPPGSFSNAARINLSNNNGDGSGSGGFHLADPKPGRNRNGNRGGRGKWRAPRGSGRCRKCNETGHYARDCKT